MYSQRAISSQLNGIDKYQILKMVMHPNLMNNDQSSAVRIRCLSSTIHVYDERGKCLTPVFSHSWQTSDRLHRREVRRLLKRTANRPREASYTEEYIRSECPTVPKHPLLFHSRSHRAAWLPSKQEEKTPHRDWHTNQQHGHKEARGLFDT